MEHKPHECSQTWQVLRSEFDKMMLDNAREHGVDGARGRRACWRCCSTASGPWACAWSDEDGAAARGARQGGGRCQRPEHDDRQPLQAARGRPRAEEGRDLDLLRRRLSRHRAATKAPRWSCRRPARRAGSGTSRCTTTSSASASSRRFDYLFNGRGDHETDLSRRGRALPGGQASASRSASASPASSPRRTTRTARGRPPATAGCWSAMPSASSIRSIRPACCWRSKSGQLAADAIAEGLAKGRHLRGAARQVGRRLQPRHGPHAPAGLRVLRRLQLRPVRQKLSAAQGPPHRPADRRPVRRQGRRSHRAHGVDEGRTARTCTPACRSSRPGGGRPEAGGRKGQRSRCSQAAEWLLLSALRSMFLSRQPLVFPSSLRPPASGLRPPPSFSCQPAGTRARLAAWSRRALFPARRLPARALRRRTASIAGRPL